jgi:hypothetical protein
LLEVAREWIIHQTDSSLLLEKIRMLAVIFNLGPAEVELK